ncbi:MAG: 50S ribosomal protein L24 [Tissierellia bacterium]|nr:50S ribosomal protein L24 [Tissierellia bacterium]
MHIKTGDTVVVVAGKSKGHQGKVLKVFPKTNKVIVEGANIQTRHDKPRGPRNPGGIVKSEGGIDSSNVMLYCSSCGAGRRSGKKILDNGKKVRVCAKCSGEFDK